MLSTYLTDAQLREGCYYLHKCRLQVSADYYFGDIKVDETMPYENNAGIVLDLAIKEKLDVNRNYWLRMQRLTNFGWTLPSEPVMYSPVLSYKPNLNTLFGVKQIDKVVRTGYEFDNHPRGFFYVHIDNNLIDDSIVNLSIVITDKFGGVAFESKRIISNRVFIDTLLDIDETYTITAYKNISDNTTAIGVMHFICSGKTPETIITSRAVDEPIGLSNVTGNVTVLGPNGNDGKIKLIKAPHLLVQENGGEYSYRYVFPE